MPAARALHRKSPEQGQARSVLRVAVGLLPHTSMVLIAVWLCFALPMALASVACAWPDLWPVLRDTVGACASAFQSAATAAGSSASDLHAALAAGHSAAMVSTH